tara:strand:+ start:80 stop:292 length:213 start_codon:yes stop_codon:yes gene_type:complete
MSKKETDTKVSNNDVAQSDVFEGKSVAELKDIAKTLNTQMAQYQTMAVKAQGALEVVLQMLPEDERSLES